jgi:IS30 family transposase
MPQCSASSPIQSTIVQFFIQTKNPNQISNQKNKNKEIAARLQAPYKWLILIAPNFLQILLQVHKGKKITTVQMHNKPPSKTKNNESENPSILVMHVHLLLPGWNEHQTYTPAYLAAI